MLVLTRKKGERVMIGDDIVVTVIDVRGDGIRIGFDAPRGISIQRAEVVAAVKEANTGAAASAAKNTDLLVGLLSKARKPDAAASSPATPASPADAAPAAQVPADAAPGAPSAPSAPAPQDADGAGAPPKPTPPKPRS